METGVFQNRMKSGGVFHIGTRPGSDAHRTVGLGCDVWLWLKLMFNTDTSLEKNTILIAFQVIGDSFL